MRRRTRECGGPADYNVPRVASLADFDIPALADLIESWGHPRAQARRILRAYYDHAGAMPLTPDQVGRRLHERLTDAVFRPHTKVALRRVAADGTGKLLIGVEEGQGKRDEGRTEEFTRPLSLVPFPYSFESVLMPSHRPDRAAGCLSSQIGCAMGCDFCASTKSGLSRDLTSGEIVEQFLHLRREATALGRRLQTVVFMGMGEPLLNFENVTAAIQRIAGQPLGALGWRQVTVSTVGIVPGIERLRRERLGVQLAVSLHAPDDDTRAAIVPPGKRYKVADILQAADAYQHDSGRVVNIEYTMLAGVNDSDSQARLLANLLAPRRMHVNLIPYNAIGPGVSGREYRRPTDDAMEHFAATLRAAGITTHFRRTRGEDIEGACGQLRERTAVLS
jgi:23S rRNA (adenine2503-C2)-methyltransferase